MTITARPSRSRTIAVIVLAGCAGVSPYRAALRGETPSSDGSVPPQFRRGATTCHAGGTPGATGQRPDRAGHEPVVAGALRVARVRQERVRCARHRRQRASAPARTSRAESLARGRTRRHRQRALPRLRRSRGRHLPRGRYQPCACQRACGAHVGARPRSAAGHRRHRSASRFRLARGDPVVPHRGPVHVHRARSRVPGRQPDRGQPSRPARLPCTGGRGPRAEPADVPGAARAERAR